MLYRPNFNSRLSSSSTSTTGRGGGRTGRGGNQDVVLTNFSASATTPTPPQVGRQSLKIPLISFLMILTCRRTTRHQSTRHLRPTQRQQGHGLQGCSGSLSGEVSGGFQLQAEANLAERFMASDLSSEHSVSLSWVFDYNLQI